MINAYLEWAAQWGIPLAALQDLYKRIGIVNIDASDKGNGQNEAYVQSRVRLLAPETLLLMRNNVGALQDKRGIPVRYGLMNDNKATNEKYKSADLIGIRQVLITQQMVGHVIGQFFSAECKEEGWQYSGQGREAAQLAWADIVNSRGGLAIFINKAENITMFS